MTRYGWIVVLGMVVGCATEGQQTRKTTPDDEEQQSAPIEAKGTGDNAIP